MYRDTRPIVSSTDSDETAPLLNTHQGRFYVIDKGEETAAESAIGHEASSSDSIRKTSADALPDPSRKTTPSDSDASSSEHEVFSADTTTNTTEADGEVNTPQNLDESPQDAGASGWRTIGTTIRVATVRMWRMLGVRLMMSTVLLSLPLSVGWMGARHLGDAACPAYGAGPYVYLILGCLGISYLLIHILMKLQCLHEIYRNGWPCVAILKCVMEFVFVAIFVIHFSVIRYLKFSTESGSEHFCDKSFYGFSVVADSLIIILIIIWLFFGRL
ncbi:hypothetical protein CEXT_429111 [Caerostris extrusa]|uniref:Uncharacterized protein n=1 Tax=Caerostris extrusa TaxID=172846 RepID=A0AAV4U1P5_CAEEX|nr:hypothetical protein CEXT_429111 [Caerostris extrusa]